MFIDFKERGRKKERETLTWERNINWLSPVCTICTSSRDLTCNLGTWPDQESNPATLWCTGWHSNPLNHLASAMHRPFKRSAWVFSCPPSHSATISTGFHNQKFWGLLPGTGAVDWGAWCGSGTHCSSRGTPVAEIDLLIFNCHTEVWDQPNPCLHFSYESRCGFFFIPLVIRILFC